MRFIKGFLAAALLLGSLAANAVPWYWDDWHSDLVRVSDGNPYTYTHNITDGANGFRPGVDSVNYGVLSILVSDDAIGGDLPAWLLGDGQETAASVSTAATGRSLATRTSTTSRCSTSS